MFMVFFFPVAVSEKKEKEVLSLVIVTFNKSNSIPVYTFFSLLFFA